MTNVPLPRWKLLENAVAAIERSLTTVENTKVVPNAFVPERVGGTVRQVDVYVETPTGIRTVRVGVEVRDKASPLDLPEVEQLVAKLKKVDVDCGCIVSTSGLTASAKQEAARNGVQIRTIDEVSHPDWWLAPAMVLDLAQVELVHWQLNFHTDDLPEAQELLAGIAATDIEFTLTSGDSGTLPAFVLAQGPRAAECPEVVRLNLKDQDTFGVTIDFSDSKGASLKCPRGPLPLPRNVYALYRMHRRVESVALSVYQEGHDVNAFTGVSQTWGKQVSAVTKLREDGTRSVSFSFDDATPAKTAISSRATGSSKGMEPTR